MRILIYYILIGSTIISNPMITLISKSKYDVITTSALMQLLSRHKDEQNMNPQRMKLSFGARVGDMYSEPTEKLTKHLIDTFLAITFCY